MFEVQNNGCINLLSANNIRVYYATMNKSVRGKLIKASSFKIYIMEKQSKQKHPTQKKERMIFFIFLKKSFDLEFIKFYIIFILFCFIIRRTDFTPGNVFPIEKHPKKEKVSIIFLTKSISFCLDTLFEMWWKLKLYLSFI